MKTQKAKKRSSMAFVEVATTAGLYVWKLFKIWLSTLFVAPFKNLDMLWVLIPIWLTWAFAEFFQEKRGTSLGNAITNAVTPFWVSLDWTRTSIRFFQAAEISLGSLVGRIALSVIVLAYGLSIIVLGIKGNNIVRYIGRIREVTYIVALLTPVFYKVIPVSFDMLLSAIIFFPLFYFTIELIDYITPNPTVLKIDTGEEGGGKKDESRLGELGGSFGNLDSLSGSEGGPDVVGQSSQLPSTSTFGRMPPGKGPGGDLGKF
ncbi:hypothetical protein HY772_03985 [Candidatus Woesearchaeota archaeon]|nr:hypothetical protein [Candidatus Woesearchaeota archaeon]